MRKANLTDRLAVNILAVDDESTIRKLSTTPDIETGAMPLTAMATNGKYDNLKAVLDHVTKHCSAGTVIEIVGAQSKDSRYDPSLDFEDPSDRAAYKPDPSWTLYHFYAAAGLHVRKQLEPLIDTLPVIGNTTTSGLFRTDRHGRTPFEVAMQNCDPASAVLLLEKMGYVAKNCGLYTLKTPILDPLRRVSDDRLLLPRLYDMTKMGLLSNEQFMKMAKAFYFIHANDPQANVEMDIVLNMAVDQDNLGFLRAAFEAFPNAVNGRVLMDDPKDPSWERLAARAEEELQNDRETGTMNVPLSVLMLRDCMEYMTNASLRAEKVDDIKERDRIMFVKYPLCNAMLDELRYSGDTVAFCWPPDMVTERLRAERMAENTEIPSPETEDLGPTIS